MSLIQSIKRNEYSPLVANTMAVALSVGYLFGPVVGACSAVAHVAFSQMNSQKQETWFPLNGKAFTQVKDYWQHTGHLFKISMIGGLVFRLLGGVRSPASWLQPCLANPLAAIYTIFHVVVLAPLIEEVVFRGFLQEKLRDVQMLIWGENSVNGKDHTQDWAWHRTNRIALQALAFGAAHYDPLDGFFNYLVVPIATYIGSKLGRIKEGFDKKPAPSNLWTNTALHAHVNAAVTSRIAVFGV